MKKGQSQNRQLIDLFFDDVQVRQEVSVFQKLYHQTQRLLHCHAADQTDDVTVVTFCHFLHHVNLVHKVPALITVSFGWW